MSDGRLLVNGTVFPWTRVSMDDTVYEGGNNGLGSTTAGLIREAVAAHEATYPLRREDYGPWFQAWLDKGAAVTGAGYASM